VFKIYTAVVGLVIVTLPDTATVLRTFRAVVGLVTVTAVIGFRIVTLPEIAAVFEMPTDVTGFRIVIPVS
jgi:hypothetical protein